MNYRLVGRGVYGFSEAERLTGIPRRRIRRWTKGYTYRYRDREEYSSPVIARETGADGEASGIDFADLIEIRFLEAFRRYGVSWRTIRVAALRARELLGRTHPFSTRFFRTDGRNILAELIREEGTTELLDLVRDQYEFERIISPYLYAGLDYADVDPERWWPMGRDRSVVVDPKRGFGAPIVAVEGVPTRVLADAFDAEPSTDFVASWFRVSTVAVADAVEFESRQA